MDAKDRRALLKDLVAGSGDAFAAAARAAFAGEATVATRNHIYRFRDANCVAVTHRDDPSPAAHAADFVGMRFLGWLIGGDRARLSLIWEAGACAVLRRPITSCRESLALTSPTMQCLRTVRLASTVVPRVAPPKVTPPPSPSRTRINVAPLVPGPRGRAVER